MEAWKNESTNWTTMYEMSYLAYLVYDYMKYWKFDKLSLLNEFFTNEADNKNLDVYDKQLLTDLKKKYPQGEILRYFTNSVDFQCVIGKNSHKKRYTIVVRGSESSKDWLYNMFVWKTDITRLFEDTESNKKKYSAIRVHSGFYKMITTDNIHTQIIDFMKDQIKENPDWEIYFSGHSMGSVTSTLLSYLMAKTLSKTKISVVALASPRVGNLAFKNDFESVPNLRLYRICYKRDIVTSFPSFYYYHVGCNLLYMNNKWNDYGRINQISYYLYNRWNPMDHLCQSYIDALKEKVDELNKADENSNKKAETSVIDDIHEEQADFL